MINFLPPSMLSASILSASLFRASISHVAVLPAAVLVLTLTGCGAKVTEPTEPPPGAAGVAQMNVPRANSPLRLEPLTQGWVGTRLWTEHQTAVDALRRIGPAALPSLVELLHGQDRLLREEAARAIALMGPEAKDAVPDLIGALSDQDAEVRKNVIRAIGQMGPSATTAIPALVQEIHRAESPRDRRLEAEVEGTQPLRGPSGSRPGSGSRSTAPSY
jgi:HEAT repeats